MSNVIEFKKKEAPAKYSTEMFNMSVYMDPDGFYEVYMQTDEGTSDWEAYLALEAACAKFQQDHGFLVVEIEDEDDESITD